MTCFVRDLIIDLTQSLEHQENTNVTWQPLIPFLNDILRGLSKEGTLKCNLFGPSAKHAKQGSTFPHEHFDAISVRWNLLKWQYQRLSSSYSIKYCTGLPGVAALNRIGYLCSAAECSPSSWSRVSTINSALLVEWLKRLVQFFEDATNKTKPLSIAVRRHPEIWSAALDLIYGAQPEDWLLVASTIVKVSSYMRKWYLLPQSISL